MNNDAKNAQAYLGKALAQEKCRNPDALVKKRLSSWEQPNQETLTVPKRSEHIDLMVVSTGRNTDGECDVSDWTNICMSGSNG